MTTLGNFAIKLQQNGVVDIANILETQGQPYAILAIINSMPASKVVMGIVAIICFVFMATTVDSSSFVAAETIMKYEDQNKLAPRWLRMFWAVISCVITFVLLQVGGFSSVQVLAILIGFQLAIVMFIVIVSAIKALKQDYPDNKSKKMKYLLKE